MTAPAIRTLALVLRRFDYSETSQVGHLFARELGRVAVLAKGVKRPGPELKGPLDLLTLAETEIRPRAGDLMLLVRYRVVTGHPGLRRRLPRLSAACYVTELLREGTRDLDPHPVLFDLAAETLRGLEAAEDGDVASIVFRFELGYLREAGFMPELRRCAGCGREAPPRRAVRFSPDLGGLFCRSCASRRPLPLVTLGRDLREAIETLRSAPSTAALPKIAAAERRILRALLDDLLERVLEKDLKAAPFLPA